MSYYDYGYGELENKLIRLLRSGAPDFDAAKKLLAAGADLNATGDDECENILSKILMGYKDSETGDGERNVCENCELRSCKDCEHNLNPNIGKSMCDIIRFFLDNGFDVNKLMVVMVHNA